MPPAHSSPVRATLGSACTPQDKEKNVFRYFCPICMWYYRRVLKTTCCSGQYICEFCAHSWMADNIQEFPVGEEPTEEQKKKREETSELCAVLLGGGALPEYEASAHVRCPFCGDNLKFTAVKKTEEVRLYTESPDTRLKLESALSNATLHAQHNNSFSPPKAGDTFEDLRRKIICFTPPHNTRKPSLASSTRSGLGTPPQVLSLSQQPDNTRTPPGPGGYGRRRASLSSPPVYHLSLARGGHTNTQQLPQLPLATRQSFSTQDEPTSEADTSIMSDSIIPPRRKSSDHKTPSTKVAEVPVGMCGCMPMSSTNDKKTRRPKSQACIVM
eukprot:TRINITY_DN103983_c0_g1_i1.p1 TRINITY_DN103983_c0_g1~~TRINITY_DN103983_c0_g1_i1.p1  ORF type:complete len:328 (+),score=37.48 TRINITY_DN103983_c0_g1_i1:46-1029(+)